jgi:hypothetical protein
MGKHADMLVGYDEDILAWAKEQASLIRAGRLRIWFSIDSLSRNAAAVSRCFSSASKDLSKVRGGSFAEISSFISDTDNFI